MPNIVHDPQEAEFGEMPHTTKAGCDWARRFYYDNGDFTNEAFGKMAPRVTLAPAPFPETSKPWPR